MKFKVGDVLLLKVVIDEVDPDDERYAYRDRVTEAWFNDSDVFAVVSTASDEPAEPEAPKEPEPRFHEGDEVIHKNKPEWGVGVVAEVNTEPSLSLNEFWQPGAGPRARGEPVPIRYHVKYAHKDEWIGGAFWWTAEGNLVPA